jgi:hypothetical protein
MQSFRQRIFEFLEVHNSGKTIGFLPELLQKPYIALKK